MNALTIKESIKREVVSFLYQVAKSNEIIYLVLLSFYVAVYSMLKIGWKLSLEQPTDTIRAFMLGIIMWGSALYLFLVIADWKKLWGKTIWLIIVAAVLLALTFCFSRSMSTNSYGVVFDIYFCVMACGKNYKKILQCIASVVTLSLIIAAVGLKAGWTVDVIKPDNIHPGHSFGIVYPNTWGFLCFLVLMIVWYLYLRRRKFLTFAIFWGCGAFMFIVAYCRTAALLTIVFPVMAVMTDWLEDLAVSRRKSDGKPQIILKVVRWCIIAIPFVMFAIMLALSLNLEWVHAHFYYTWFHNFAMRFVVGGLFLRQYGLVWIGNVLKSNTLQIVNVNNDFLEVRILDSSFVAYLLMRGVLWVLGVLTWLSLSIWKALNKKDFAIPYLVFIILIFAMMERPGLEVWYNFVLLYPLAKAGGKAGTHDILDFNPLFVERGRDPGETESVSDVNADQSKDPEDVD